MSWALMITGLAGPLHGKGEAPKPSLTFSKPRLDFGPTILGSPAEGSVTIRNRTGSSLPLEFRDSDLTVFRIGGHDCGCCLAADQSCTLKIQFSPLGSLPVSEALSIQYLPADGKRHVVRFPLAGSGQERKPVVLPLALRFPHQRTGTRSDAQTVGIYNNDAAPIEIRRVMVNSDFLLDPAGIPQSVPVHGAAYFSLRFAPQKPGLHSGKLSIWIGADPTPRVVVLRGFGSRSFWCHLGHWRLTNLGLTLLLAVLYWVGMTAARWHRVARPTRELLTAQIESLKAEVKTLTAGSPAALPSTDATALLDKASKLFGDSNWPRFADVLYWSRGQENAGWAYVHEVEVHLVPCRDEAFVKARLESLETLLRQADDVPAKELADRLHAELTSTATPVNPARRKALLAEALAAHYERTDHNHSDLMDWQNKASWLVISGLVLIVSLVCAYPEHAVLLLMGAMGGLVSRLSRTLTSKTLPSDYGASWTTLFLSPVSGALGGWLGILLASLAFKLGVLGAAFNVEWDQPIGGLAMAIAVVFGFSERLLSSVLDKVAGKAEEGSGASTSQSTRPGLKITVSPQLPDGTVGTVYPPVKLTATGVTGAISAIKWRRAAGSADLPVGLKIVGDEIQGTPTQAVQGHVFSIEVEDQGKTASQQLKITIV